jgi:branched-chain amino acid transport system permease protein
VVGPFWLVILIAPPLLALFFLSSYGLHLVTLAGVYALMGTGYQLVFGQLRALNLAQGALFGVGAYTVALGAPALGAAGLPMAALAAALLAGVVAWPAVRLQSHYFALATLALASLVGLFAVNAEAITGGANGVIGFGARLPRGRVLLVVVWSCLVVAVLAYACVFAGRPGEKARMIRESPLAAATLGIDAARWQIVALVIGGALAGLAGGFSASLTGAVSPEATGFPLMVLCLTSVVVGGTRHPMGAVLGAALAVGLPEVLREFEGGWLLAYAVITLAIVLWAPEGLATLIDRMRHAKPAVPTLAAAGDSLPPAIGPRCLALDRVTKRFGGVVALHDVSLALGRGEIVGLIGPNGSGKTTLLNVVCGLERSDHGAITLDGARIDRLPAHAIAHHGIARSFQAPTLPPRSTAWAAVDAAARLDAVAALGLVGLADRALVPCGRLAPGERRLVDLARALATGAAFLLLDEPAAGLNDTERRRLGGVLARLRDSGRGVLIIDHDIELLSGVCDRLVCLDQGVAIADATPAQVRADRAVQASFLGLPRAAA